MIKFQPSPSDIHKLALSSCWRPECLEYIKMRDGGGEIVGHKHPVREEGQVISGKQYTFFVLVASLILFFKYFVFISIIEI
jgi:hypothetical protein